MQRSSDDVQAGWVILQSFPEHVDVLAFMNAVETLYGMSYRCYISCCVILQSAESVRFKQPMMFDAFCCLSFVLVASAVVCVQ